MSRITCHLSPVTCHLSHFIKKKITIQKKWTKGLSYWWRVCYQWGLLRIVSWVSQVETSIEIGFLHFFSIFHITKCKVQWWNLKKHKITVFNKSNHYYEHMFHSSHGSYRNVNTYINICIFMPLLRIIKNKPHKADISCFIKGHIYHPSIQQQYQAN